MKSEYFVLLPIDIYCSLQSFAATALKTKSYDENLVTAKCACINDGASLNFNWISELNFKATACASGGIQLLFAKAK